MWICFQITRGSAKAGGALVEWNKQCILIFRLTTNIVLVNYDYSLFILVRNFRTIFVFETFVHLLSLVRNFRTFAVFEISGQNVVYETSVHFLCLKLPDTAGCGE